MTCFHPQTVWRSKEINPNGKRSITFNPAHAYERDSPLQIRCGNCIGCRLAKSKEWAIRCMHEAQLYENNCFLTLTFDEFHLNSPELFPRGPSLSNDHHQKFLKRLRKKYGPKIRYYLCGEYGEKLQRPHYHVCLFNHDFSDKILYKTTNGNRLYISDSLAELWPFGFHTIGDLTFETAAYTARYCMKKINGDDAYEHYQSYDLETGEIVHLKPEYNAMSRRPGLAADWLKKYHDDVYPHDFIVHNGHKSKPPKYYDNYLEKVRPFEYDELIDERAIRALLQSGDSTKERLADREYIVYQKNTLLSRNLEKDENR